MKKPLMENFIFCAMIIKQCFVVFYFRRRLGKGPKYASDSLICQPTIYKLAEGDEKGFFTFIRKMGEKTGDFF